MAANCYLCDKPTGNNDKAFFANRWWHKPCLIKCLDLLLDLQKRYPDARKIVPEDVQLFLFPGSGEPDSSGCPWNHLPGCHEAKTGLT